MYNDVLRKKPVIYVKDYHNETQTILNDAYNIQERRKFGDMADLSFTIPYYQFDGYNNLVVDDANIPVTNINLQFIFAEQLIEFNGKYYIVKDIEESREQSNKLTVNVRCKEKAIELSYKNIQFLSTTPPLYNAINAKANMLNVLVAGYTILDDDGVSAGSTSINVSGAGSFSLIGSRVAVIDGTGQGQDRRIVGQSGDSLTISPAWDAIPNSTSYVKVHNSTWTVGDVDSSFLLDGGTPIYRSFQFQGETKTQSLYQIAERFEGNLTYSYEYDSTYDDFVNKVNLVLPNNYDNVEFRYNKNLQRVIRRIDSNEQIYTRLYPFGKNNLSINDMPTQSRTDSGVTYDFHINGQSYIENYQYFLGLGYDIDFCRKNFRYDFDLNNDTYVDAVDLYNDAQDILERASVPKIEYVISAIDLYTLTGYDYEYFEEGDTIRVIDNELSLDFFATVIEKPTNWDNPQRSSLILANYIENLGDYISQVIARANRTADLKKLYGKTIAYSIADKATSVNWRYADFVIEEGEENPDYVIRDVLEFIRNEALTNNKSVELLIYDGLYEFQDEIIVDMQGIYGVKIYGQGENTIFRPKYEESVNNALEIRNCTNLEISNINFQHAYEDIAGTDYVHGFDYAIYLDNVSFATVKNNVFSYQDEGAVFVLNSDNVSIFDNYFDWSNVQYADIYSVTSLPDYIIISDNTDNIRIYNNIFNQILYRDGCINVEGTGSSDRLEGELMISDNYFYTDRLFDEGDSRTVRIIDVVFAQDNAIIKSNKIIIKQNVGANINTSVVGIFLNYVDGALVTNNYIDGYIEIAINANVEAQNNTIIGNQISIVCDGGTIYKVWCLDDNNSIQNNTVRNESKYVTSPVTTTDVYGIRNSGDNCVISGNDLKYSGTVSLYNTGDNCMISNNDLRFATTTNFTDLGTGTITLGGNAT